MILTRTYSFAAIALAAFALPPLTPAHAETLSFDNGWSVNSSSLFCRASRDFTDGGYLTLDLSAMSDPSWDRSTGNVMSGLLPRFPIGDEPGVESFYENSNFSDFSDAFNQHFGMEILVGETQVLDMDGPINRMSFTESDTPEGYSFTLHTYPFLVALGGAESLDIRFSGETIVSVPLGGSGMVAALRSCVLDGRDDRDAIIADYPELAADR